MRQHCDQYLLRRPNFIKENFQFVKELGDRVWFVLLHDLFIIKQLTKRRSCWIGQASSFESTRLINLINIISIIQFWMILHVCKICHFACNSPIRIWNIYWFSFSILVTTKIYLEDLSHSLRRADGLKNGSTGLYKPVREDSKFAPNLKVTKH